MKTLTLALTLLAATCASTSAFALDFSGIRNWTGTGANRAALVIDFKDSGPAYAWGYYFDGARTGYDMLSAIAAADPALSFTFTQYSFGKAIDGISYRGLATAGFDPGTPGYWAYYTATPLPANWVSSNVGLEARTLTNDVWDGLSWAPAFAATAPRGDIVAAAPVPEPASLAALGLGALALLRRRRA